MIAVHGPHTWGEPFFASNDFIMVNLLGPLELEFKTRDPGSAAVEDPFDWDFGDTAGLDNGFEVRHIYAAPGEYTVTVRVQTTEGEKTSSITFTLPATTRAGKKEGEERIQPKAA
jgi:PKD domain